MMIAVIRPSLRLLLRPSRNARWKAASLSLAVSTVASKAHDLYGYRLVDAAL